MTQKDSEEEIVGVSSHNLKIHDKYIAQKWNSYYHVHPITLR